MLADEMRCSRDTAARALRELDDSRLAVNATPGRWHGSRRKFHLGAMPGNTPHECVAASFGRPAGKYREAVGT